MGDQAAANEDGESGEPQPGEPTSECLGPNPSTPDQSCASTCCVYTAS